MNNKLYRDKQWLQKQFDEVKRTNLIANMCGVTDNTIEKWVKKLNITKNPLRRMSCRTHKLNENYFSTIDNEK